MRSGSSSSSSRSLKSTNLSVICCFIRANPLGVNCCRFARTNLAEFSSCLLAFVAIYSNSLFNWRPPCNGKHTHGTRMNLKCSGVPRVVSYHKFRGSKCGRELKPTDSSKTGKNLTADLDRLTTVETTVMDGVL